MTKIPLAASDRRRRAAHEPDVLMRNRFVELNPVLSDNGPAYVSRPGLRFWQQINGGQGPIRATYQSPGAFDDDLFVVAYNSLFRVDSQTGIPTLITNLLSGGDSNAAVRMAATGDIGDIGPRLWIADGRDLFVYVEDGYAHGTLTMSMQAADGDVVRIGTVYYKMVTGSVDAGTPAGTLANPWLVKIGPVSILQSLTNLYRAVNATGTPGTTYSTALTDPNDEAVATDATSAGMNVRAIALGAFGNVVVTTETGANMAWTNGATLTGGGTPGIILVPTPEEVGVLDVCNINNFIIVIPSQGEGINGRFYWVQPGETSIDPLDFATAERSTDPIYQVRVFNDNFWLPGQNTTEVWYMTGDPDAPVQRQQGIIFDRGVIPGGAIQVKDSMVVIDSDGGVFQIQGQEKRISTPDIEERLRKAINFSNIFGSL